VYNNDSVIKQFNSRDILDHMISLKQNKMVDQDCWHVWAIMHVYINSSVDFKHKSLENLFLYILVEKL